MDACHILLGRPCMFHRRVMYDGRKNTCQFEKDRTSFNKHRINDEVEKVAKVMSLASLTSQDDKIHFRNVCKNI